MEPSNTQKYSCGCASQEHGTSRKKLGHLRYPNLIHQNIAFRRGLHDHSKPELVDMLAIPLLTLPPLHAHCSPIKPQPLLMHMMSS